MRELTMQECDAVGGGMVGGGYGPNGIPLLDASATRPPGTNSWGEPTGGNSGSGTNACEVKFTEPSRTETTSCTYSLLPPNISCTTTTSTTSGGNTTTCPPGSVPRP
jgi:hypothetical protein